LIPICSTIQDSNGRRLEIGDLHTVWGPKAARTNDNALVIRLE